MAEDLKYKFLDVVEHLRQKIFSILMVLLQQLQV